jgi:hypothetical protein
VIGVARPCSAKKRIRKPANHVKTSSGVAWRYELSWSWKVPWSTVLTATVMPSVSSQCAIAAAIAVRGTSSE